MDKKQHLTLGSLFDGIGGFPYAASFFGIEALWASDILPCAVSVTKRHMSHMEHVGDITKLHGGKLPPVDIITFGSPCQDVSTAGRRSGINGERSVLFFEAIRIINEMREATDGKYPTWAIWENVPGALSSNQGLDYKAVLEAFTEAEVPVPQSGKWANAGMVRGGRADVAWCVYNAQYFGTAQRRRRIFLVADFGGKRAGEILFVHKSLQGYFAAGGTPRQGPAAYAAGGADGAGGNIAFACNQRDEVRDLRDLSAALCAQPGMKQQTFIADGSIAILNDQGGDRINVEQSGCSPTLRSETHGHPPVVAREAYPINTQLATRHMALGENTGFGVGGDGDPAFTLLESHSHAVAICETNGESVSANCLTSWDIQQSRIFTENSVSPTLAGADGGGGRNPRGLIYTAGFCAGAGAKARGVGYEDECAPTLKGGGGGFQMPAVVCAAFMGDSSPSSYGIEYMEEGAPTLKPRLSGTPCLCAATGQTGAEVLENCAPMLTCHHEQPILYKAVGVHQNQSGDVNTADTAYSLATTGNATSRNAPLVAHPKVSGTLCASGAGLSRPVGKASETDLCVVQQSPGVEPIPIHDKATRYSGGGDTRKNDGAGNGLGVGKSGDPAPTITAGDRHAVAAYCLQGNMIGRKDENGPRGNGVNENVSFTLNATDSHAVAAVDCRNMRERPELSGTLQAKENGSYSLNYQNPVRMGYIVRRLTPTECERLQGYPDGWTACGHDGKPISDTRRYMMLGNSVAVPCVAYIMMGIAEAHGKAVQTSEHGDSGFH